MLPAVTASYEIPVASLIGVAFTDAWICGRPALIGTDVYVLMNIRGTDVHDTLGVAVFKGEDLGRGTWSLYDTIATGSLDAWQRPADTYTDGTHLYVLYATSDQTLQLTMYEPGHVPPTIQAPMSAPLSISGLVRTIPDAIRLVRRGDASNVEGGSGDFIAVWTLWLHGDDPFIPSSVYCSNTSGANFESGWTTPIELTPDLREFSFRSWNLMDAVMGSDNKLHVLSAASDAGHQQGRLLHSDMLLDGSVSSRLVLPLYEARAGLPADGTRGMVFNGRVVFPVVFGDGPSPFSSGWFVPATVSADEFIPTDWTVSLMTSRDPSAGNLSGPHSTYAIVARGLAYVFYPNSFDPPAAGASYDPQAFYYGMPYVDAPEVPETIAFPAGSPDDTIDNESAGYEQVHLSVLNSRYIGYASESVAADGSGGFVRKFAFRLMDLGAGGGGPRARYYGW